LPFLGENFAGYVESGFLTSNRGDFSDAMFKSYISTPLLIIDGKKGALKVGNLPLYQVPKLILNLLHLNQKTIMDFTAPPSDTIIRPLTGLHFDELKNGKLSICKEPPYSPECERSLTWIKLIETVSNDLFIGTQKTRSFID
jgi:hypothetical protein